MQLPETIRTRPISWLLGVIAGILVFLGTVWGLFFKDKNLTDIWHEGGLLTIILRVCVAGILFFIVTISISQIPKIRKLAAHPNRKKPMTIAIVGLVGAVVAILLWHVIAPTTTAANGSGSDSGEPESAPAGPVVPDSAPPKTEAAFPDAFSQLADKMKNAPSNAIVKMNVNLLRRPGSKFSIGSCPGANCMQFEVGNIGIDEGFLVQDLILRGDGFGLKRNPKTKALHLDAALHSNGAVLDIPFVEGDMVLKFALASHSTFELVTSHGDLKFRVADTNTASLKLSIELLPPSGFRAPRKPRTTVPP